VQRTRQVILEYLKHHGRASLDQLAHTAGLAPMTVRGHLSVLERDGVIASEEERGKVGRPHFVYTLTPHGHDLFPKSYHVLCNRILDAVAASADEIARATPDELVKQIAHCWAGDYAARVQGQPLEEQVKILTQIRTEEGAMASFEKADDGYLLHQHHCPASCVAARHPEIVCASEISYMRVLLGASVERVHWFLKGDATCSYRIRPARSAPKSDASAAPRSEGEPDPSPAPPWRPAIPD
jgi:predicted ArsR family transcriptional regulator